MTERLHQIKELPVGDITPSDARILLLLARRLLVRLDDRRETPQTLARHGLCRRRRSDYQGLQLLKPITPLKPFSGKEIYHGKYFDGFERLDCRSTPTSQTSQTFQTAQTFYSKSWQSAANIIAANSDTGTGLYLTDFGSGGDKGSRTPDLLNAIETLYQLSYIPNKEVARIISYRRAVVNGELSQSFRR